MGECWKIGASLFGPFLRRLLLHLHLIFGLKYLPFLGLLYAYGGGSSGLWLGFYLDKARFCSLPSHDRKPDELSDIPMLHTANNSVSVAEQTGC